MLSLVLKQTRRFLREEVDPAVIDRDATIDSRLLEKAGDIGLFALAIPEQFGGFGFSLGEVSQVVTEVARWDRSFATTLGLHAGLGTRALIELGATDVQEEWLPKLASGEAIGAFAATESGAGSDLTGIRTCAHLQGDSLTLSGEKAYVTNAGWAGLFTVLAATPDHGGNRAQGLVCVPREKQGVSVGPEEHKMGIRGSSTASLLLENVRVPRSYLIGKPGLGANHAHRVLEWGRAMMAAGCYGTADAALLATLDYVRQRKQFGKDLLSFGATRAQLAHMATTNFAMDALLSEVFRAEDEGRSLTLLSTAAKVFCSEGAFGVCDRAIQLHGALGFIEGAGIERMARDCRVTRIFEGANDVLLVRLGAELLTRRQVVSPRLHQASDESEAATEWERVYDLFLISLYQVREERGLSAIRHQPLLQALARAEINLLAASASLVSGGHLEGERGKILSQAATRTCLERAAAALEFLPKVDRQAQRDEMVVEALVGHSIRPTATNESAQMEAQR